MSVPPPGNDNATQHPLGVSPETLKIVCGCILGVFDGARLPRMAGVLICASVIGDVLADQSEADREEALSALLATVRDIAVWRQAERESQAP